MSDYTAPTTLDDLDEDRRASVLGILRIARAFDGSIKVDPRDVADQCEDYAVYESLTRAVADIRATGAWGATVVGLSDGSYRILLPGAPGG